MALQTGKNVAVNYKVEGTINTPPGATGAKRFRLTPSGGLNLRRSEIRSAEVRSDGQTPMGRLGSKVVNGAYSGELSVGTFDEIIEAVMRSTWAASVTIDQSTMTSITTGANTIVAAGGSWITQGVRVGDIVRLANHSEASNNGKNLRVTAVTTSTITVAETLVVNAVADNSFTLTVGKKLKNAATPTRRTFYIEQVYNDLDASVGFGGCRFVSMKLVGQPDGMVNVEFGVLGLDGVVYTGASSPYFTDPTMTTTTSLVWNDAKIRFNGVDIVNLSSFEITFNLGGSTLPVLAPTSPDVFEEQLDISGTYSAARASLNEVEAFLAETEAELFINFVEPENEPKDYISLFVPRVKRTGADAPLGGEGAMIETIPFFTGKKEGVTGYDDTMATFLTSAA